MLTQHFLQTRALQRPNKIALVCGERRFSYGQLDAMANRLGWALREMGVGRGDRVGIYLRNSLEAVVSMFAIMKAGAVFVAVSPQMKGEKLISILNNCQAKAVVLDGKSVAKGLLDRLVAEVKSVQHVVDCGGKAVARNNGHLRYHDFATIQTAYPTTALPEVNIDLDLACLIYTSGTTGESKGVMCDHSNVMFVTRSVAQYLKHTEADIVLNVLPISFSYGLYQVMVTFFTGGTLVMEESFAFPELIMERMAQERVTGFAGVPTIYSMLLNLEMKHLDLSALRYMTNAAAGLPVEHVKRLRARFPKVELYLMHGLTEVARTMYLPPEQVDSRPGSSGIAMPGTELWVEDEEGRRLGPGEVGELVVRGRHVMRGYWMAPELTAQRFRPGPIPGERVCYSGDLFRTDEQGYFYFVSRKDDIIKSRGEKVAPREVESILYAIPGVREAAVIGIPHPLLGQAIKAFVVAPGAELTEAKIIAHCKARLEDFMVPREVAFLAELPKTPSGKLRRMDLR